MSDTGVGNVSRRQFLAGAGAAAATVATAGCTRQVRSIAGRSSDQVSLSIAALPADEDDAAVRIAQHLRSNLDAVGVSTSVDFFSAETFWVEFLVNQSFDIAVGAHPGGEDPDLLYEMFHSRFSAESGWQNPYGFTDIELDRLLERQRSETGARRAETVAEILRMTAREQPFTPLCVPIEHRLTAPAHAPVIEDRPFSWAGDLLAVEPNGETGGAADELVVVVRDTAPTENLNPLAVEYRRTDAVTGLVYDPLLATTGDGRTPWLASTVEWGDGSAEITLRDATWHDGEPVTASDVAFTYQMLADTSLGGLESPVPTQRFRGRGELVSAVEVHDESTVTLSVVAAEEVASRALTVPVLPEHVWADRTDTAAAGGVVDDERTTEAMVASNIPPIGSGPYAFLDSSERDEVVLERYPDHFAQAADDLAGFRPPAERLRLVVAPSDAAAREWIEDGNAALTVSPVRHDTGAEVTDDDPVRVVETPTPRFYHIAYNTRRSPLSNVRFRRLASRLVDKSWVVTDVFDGTARPMTTPMPAESWVPTELEWDGNDPELPFLGTNGHLNADAARDQLVGMGYQYNEDGDLIAVGGG